ncbi:DUF5753 domain-containing protein [Saccharopolyspora pogona]|uniref:DUF5753 domain-containing protein n=1 Tax=Saccharopolyspora pogona TaxID=333966 RepID=UPI001686D0E0|nr:DUF5753 domain-containing protein [Saccharopolyspora pogona]
MRQSEKLCQLGLGVQLRKLREDARMSTRSVAKALGEREAVAITDVQASLIPGLAHTADYARLILGSGATAGIELENKVATRLGRQAVLSRPRAPKVSFFIDEGALRRTLGNRRVLRDQLEKLIIEQRRDNVGIRVIPFDRGPNSSIRASFSLYELASGSPYVFVEVYSLGLFVTDPSEVAPFVEVCRSLDKSALDEDESSALIRKIAESLDNE